MPRCWPQWVKYLSVLPQEPHKRIFAVLSVSLNPVAMAHLWELGIHECVELPTTIAQRSIYTLCPPMQLQFFHSLSTQGSQSHGVPRIHSALPICPIYRELEILQSQLLVCIALVA